jgi:aromatic ring hydroxylase
MIEKFTLTMDMTGVSGGFSPLTRRHQSGDVSDAYLAVDRWKNFQKQNLVEQISAFVAYVFIIFLILYR